MFKKQVREGMIKERLALSEHELAEKSRVIMDHISSLPEYRRAGLIMAYVDFNNEVQTRGFIAGAMRGGKRLAVPLTMIKERRLVPSLLLDFPGDLAPGVYGILEPKSECLRPLEPGELDMVIVPGLAFDRRGNRLGYGGGFYDRFLPQTKAGCLWVAPAFEFQLREDVCSEEHDVPVDMVVTEKGITSC